MIKYRFFRVLGSEFQVLLRPGQFVLTTDVNETHDADERKWPASEKIVERSRVSARVHIGRNEGHITELARHVSR